MKIHVNVMELLIEQEIVKYLKTPEYKHLRGDIVSLMTYALNRVPPLYASSVQGLKSQINRAKQDYRSHIENAVRWSFTAVNKAPRQRSPDLTREIYQRVLAETRAAVRHRELSPIDLPEMIDSMVPQDPDETPPDPKPGDGETPEAMEHDALAEGELDPSNGEGYDSQDGPLDSLDLESSDLSLSESEAAMA